MPARHFSPGVKSVWLLAAAVSLFALAFVYFRGQDSNWDLLNYHYFSGYSLLHGSYVNDIAPSGLQSFLNPVPNILAFLALSQLAFPASAWAIAGVQLLSLPLLLLIGRQLGRDLGFAQITAAEFLALAVCLLAPLWWSELGTSFSDSTMTPLVLLGLYLGLRGVAQGEKARSALVCSGVCFGLATALKLTNAPFAIGFLAALAGISIQYRWQSAMRLLLLLAAGMATGFLPTLWWNVYLLQDWGSPLFPLYNAWFKSPYFDLVNFRDLRWRFESMAAFARYLWDSVWGTAKTSEFPFADARLLMFPALATLALPRRRKYGSQPKVALSFLLFFGVSFLLWAALFAYQRYLIPVELLFGFGIWILLSRIFPNPKPVTWLLAGCLVVSAALIKVPDWGHTQARVAQANPFGVQLPAELTATPARYLVVGHAITYILPFLHKDSQFYGLGTLSSQADALIRAAVARQDARALRILLRQEVAAVSLWERLSSFGFAPNNTRLSCFHFRTDIDGYVICEIDAGLKGKQHALAPIDIDFQDKQRLLPPSVLGFRGLAPQEAWGRWSDGDQVTVQFANCLPQGKLAVDLRGHAFGPNIGQPVKLVLGTSQATMVLGESDQDLRITIDNKEECQNTLTLLVPEKASPLELGRSADSRTLGIGLVRLGIRTIG